VHAHRKHREVYRLSVVVGRCFVEVKTVTGIFHPHSFVATGVLTGLWLGHDMCQLPQVARVLIGPCDEGAVDDCRVGGAALFSFVVMMSHLCDLWCWCGFVLNIYNSFSFFSSCLK